MFSGRGAFVLEINYKFIRRDSVQSVETIL